MAGYYKAQIEKAKDTETLNNIIEELAFAGLDRADYYDLFDEATDRIADLLRWD